MIAVGKGPPLVLIPGIQGRWEWMYPAVRALAESFHVIAYSLAGEPQATLGLPRLGGDSAASRTLAVARPQHFDDYVAQLDDILARAGLDTAIVCGVSFGGWIAARYAMLRSERVDRLVLVSTPGPRWQPDEDLARYLKAPTLFAPAFAVRSVRRLYREVRLALPGRSERRRFVVDRVRRFVGTPASPRRMAHRVQLAREVDFSALTIGAETLLVTGESGLDAVVPVEHTLEYLQLVPRSRHVRIARTGHIGIVTRPDAFAACLAGFCGVSRLRDAAAPVAAGLSNAPGGLPASFGR